jgi:hypothetical protein
LPRALGEAMRENGAAGIPRWVTEFGYPSRPGGIGAPTLEVQQAQRLRDMYDVLYGRANPPSAMIVHRLVDDGPNPHYPTAFLQQLQGAAGPPYADDLEQRLMGTVRKDKYLSRKTAFCLLAVKVGSPNPGYCTP